MIKATNDPNGGAPHAAYDGAYEVVVAGAGAAGLDAALLWGRARRVLVTTGRRDELLTRPGCTKDDNGRVPTGRTPIAGIWTTGDVIGPRAQVVTAAGTGSAACAISNGLLDEDVDHAVQQRRAAERGDGR